VNNSAWEGSFTSSAVPALLATSARKVASSSESRSPSVFDELDQVFRAGHSQGRNWIPLQARNLAIRFTLGLGHYASIRTLLPVSGQAQVVDSVS
jgi:hypothetical protein